MPSILDLCKRVAMNKNKLQKAFQLTEGKSIGEYVRTLRIEQALELLEQSDMTVQEIAAAIRYHGVSNFYHTFQQKFGLGIRAIRSSRQAGVKVVSSSDRISSTRPSHGAKSSRVMPK